MTPHENAAEAQQKARIERQDTARAFAEVFGLPRRRTAAQLKVIGHLAVCAGDDGNAYRFNEAKDGIALVAAGIHRDGAKSVLRVIERQISIAADLKAPTPKVVTVKR